MSRGLCLTVPCFRVRPVGSEHGTEIEACFRQCKSAVTKTESQPSKCGYCLMYGLSLSYRCFAVIHWADRELCDPSGRPMIQRSTYTCIVTTPSEHRHDQQDCISSCSYYLVNSSSICHAAVSVRQAVRRGTILAIPRKQAPANVSNLTSDFTNVSAPIFTLWPESRVMHAAHIDTGAWSS